jgi:hypothetical protein
MDLKPKRTDAQERKEDQTIERDILLLKEYGFKKRTLGQPSSNLRKIDGFGMRQLDRLKMLLLRHEQMVGKYPEQIRRGIEMNDPGSFASALVILSPMLRDFMS